MITIRVYENRWNNEKVSIGVELENKALEKCKILYYHTHHVAFTGAIHEARVIAINTVMTVQIALQFAGVDCYTEFPKTSEWERLTK